MGAVTCCKAVWDVMKQQNYGRIMMTSSPAGVYGNYGHSNDGAANMGLIGLMNTLHLEGIRYGIRVNTLSPVVCSQLFGGLIDESYAREESRESITAAMMYLVSDQAPARYTLSAGEGAYSATRIYETSGIYLDCKQQAPEHLAEQIGAIVDADGQIMLQQSAEQSMRFISQVKKAQRSLFARMPGALLSELKNNTPSNIEASSPDDAGCSLFSRLWRVNSG